MPSVAEYADSKNLRVAGGATDTSGGVVVPNGTKVGITRFIASASANTTILLTWDWGGAGQMVFSSTRTAIEASVDSGLAFNQVAGDGVKKLQIIIINDGLTQSPWVSGYFEADEVD